MGKKHDPRYRCPKCGSTSIEIAALVWVELIQQDDGNFETDADSDRLTDHDHDWDSDSRADCLGCHQSGMVSDFDTK